VSEQHKTSEVLDLAADVIEQRGWCTGTWNNTREDAPVCIEGGIAAALGLEIDLGGSDEATYGSFITCPAYTAVQNYLGLNDFLYGWNDEVSHSDSETLVYARSKEQVVEVLRAAAAVERAKEESLENMEIKK
jgi:hypothetical protein